MSKVTAYERNLVNVLISNMRVTVIELGLWFDSMRMDRPKGMIRSHYKKAVNACRIAANASEKLHNYSRWDLISEVEFTVMNDYHRSVIADIESRGFDFQEFLSEIVNRSDLGYDF
ncbi:hypothetical protein QJS26_gp65 [Serratia phage vB_SmaS_Stoker]|uniref:Uncharacterized protein n=1 Tax=Serratia phage vB_SmaS_Stoker TaxID=2902692 RepID=A0AC61TQH8_9CAUD|nr:hypothetical protein QJS26_gp65 [Serratia phage vB_SmaS_Stoker]UGO53811.1 hypothetical protein STOKER_65 [Serratia phage vB_SmaS_Stoker]